MSWGLLKLLYGIHIYEPTPFLWSCNGQKIDINCLRIKTFKVRIGKEWLACQDQQHFSMNSCIRKYGKKRTMFCTLQRIIKSYCKCSNKIVYKFWYRGVKMILRFHFHKLWYAHYRSSCVSLIGMQSFKAVNEQKMNW